MSDRHQAEALLETAVTALNRDACFEATLDRIPVPVYTTDASGTVTYCNPACAEFAGREPQVGRDRWCVTWALYTTTGDSLPHDKCPMADAIREKRPIRNAVAIAERPDGTRRAFTPYPTPLFAADGSVRGAVNMLVDVTDEQRDVLAEQACRCRRLAGATYDREVSSALGAMAEGFERTAKDLCRA